MPRKMTARRFARHYPVVGQSALDEEAKYLAREFDDYLLLSANDLRKHTDDRYKASVRAWEALQQQIASLSERDAEVVRCILFRDILHVLELHRAFCRSRQPESAPPISERARLPAQARHAEFSEWLFGQP